MRYSVGIFLSFLMLAVVSTACTSSTNSLSEVASTETPPTSPVTVPIITYQDNLNKLDSYRANLIVDFDGSRDGQPISGHIEALTEINRTISAHHRYLAETDAENNTEISDFIQVGNGTHLSKDDKSIYVTQKPDQQISPAEVGFLEPEKFIIIPATLSGPPQIEAVDGRNMLHYSFTERDLAVVDVVFEQATGEFWLATPENYLVQYVISATLKTLVPIPNAHLLDEGSLRLSYTLSDVDADIPITLPRPADLTPPVFAGFPLPPETTPTAIYPMLMEYTSIISPISATLFYQTSLPTRGWIEESAELFEEKSRLVFSKNEQRLTILVTPTDSPDTIKISLDMNIQSSD